MKVNKKKKNKEGPKLAMEVEKQTNKRQGKGNNQQIQSCILAVLQAGRYKPWEKRPKKERNKGKETGQENIRIRRREKRQRLECNKANRRNDSTAGKQEGRKGAAGGNGKGHGKEEQQIKKNT